MSVRHVEGEAVHRPPPLEPHADGADLARVRPVGVDPHAGVLGEPARRHAERRQRVDDQLLDVAHVLGRAEPVAELHDRVADELARAVVGDVAAAADRRRGRRRPRPGRSAGCARGRTAART